MKALVIIIFISSGCFCPLAPASNRNLFLVGDEKDTLQIASKIALAKQFYHADTPNFDSTFICLNQALGLSKARSDSYYSYVIYKLYSEILYKNGNYSLAIDYYFKMLNLLDKTKKKTAILELKKEYAALYRSIGICMSSIDMEKALDYFRKSLEKTEEICAINPNCPAIDEIRLLVYNDMGAAWSDAARFDSAFFYCRKALNYPVKINNAAYYASLHYHLGLCYFHQNNREKAMPELLAAIEISRKSGDIRIETDAVGILAKIYEQQNDFYRAAQMFRLSNVLKDSVSNATRIKELSQIETQYLLEKQQRESELNRQFILDRRKLRIWQTLFVAVSLLSLLTIILLFYLNRRMKNKNNLLEQQNLLLQNENLELKNRPSNPNEDSVWNEYGLLSQHLPQDFYNNLHQQHPNLTPNEKKLSAFIRLNMSSKEISSITFQSVKSIEIARSRLRQKLKLKRNVNLNVYLQGF
jgi:tetratricopeptide (TPR) repeat protein